MKKILIVLLIAIFIGVAVGCNNTSKKKTLILATTTSVNDSGLLSEILPRFRKQKGIKVKLIAVGSGEALEMGKRGDADILIVHSPDKEKELLKQGAAVKRTSFMYNYFVIVGPKKDFAGVREASSAEEAFRRIVNKKQTFVSRGDESGTEKKELKIWKKAAIKPRKPYYIDTGQGMLKTLLIANEKKAYTLTDKSTFISAEKDLGDLKILLTKKESLKNIYSVIELNKKLKINTKAAKIFKKWLLSKKILNVISNFGVKKYKEPLFYIID